MSSTGQKKEGTALHPCDNSMDGIRENTPTSKDRKVKNEPVISLYYFYLKKIQWKKDGWIKTVDLCEQILKGIERRIYLFA